MTDAQDISLNRTWTKEENALLRKGYNLGRADTIKKVEEILDSRKVECIMQYRQWWINLGSLKNKIKEVLGE